MQDRAYAAHFLEPGRGRTAHLFDFAFEVEHSFRRQLDKVVYRSHRLAAVRARFGLISQQRRAVGALASAQIKAISKDELPNAPLLQGQERLVKTQYSFLFFLRGRNELFDQIEFALSLDFELDLQG